jgi:hypothetical protein
MPGPHGGAHRIASSPKIAHFASGIALATIVGQQRPTGPAAKGRGAMEEENVVDIDMKGAPACGRCFMLVARYAPQVEAPTGTYHRECYEAWYFGRFGRRPRLHTKGSRHLYEVRDKAA